MEDSNENAKWVPNHPYRRHLASQSVLIVGVIAIIACATAAWLGWYRPQALVAATGLGSTLLAFATFLFYRQEKERRIEHRALTASETRVGDIINSAMDAIITIDHRQHIVLYNDAAERVFGWPRDAVLGQSLDILIPARFHKVHAQHVQQFGTTGVTSRRMGENRVLTGLRADGEEFPVEASISQFGEGTEKLYTAIVRDVTLRVKAEEALQRSREELLELATAANHLREQEQRRVARELHDELAQALTGLKMDVAWLKGKLPPSAPSLGDKLGAMETLLDSTVAATRRISSDLRPMMLDDLGLVPAIEWLTQSFTERSGLHCHLTIKDPNLELRDPHATTIYRVLQESLTNVAKHARASRVDVSLDRQEQEIILTVRDDGTGFSSDNARKPNSYGLIGMRERIYLLGGRMRLDSAPGKGTSVEVRLSLPENIA